MSANDFVAILAHELRQPIQAAAAALSVMKTPDPQTREKAHAVLDRQIGQMARLVEDLLNVSRIVRGDVPLRRTVVDLRDVVRHSVDTAAPAIQARQHAIEVRLPERPVLVHADALRLQQVIVNVLSNAAKYTPPSGRIAVEVASTAARAIVRVKDNGIGIPRQALNRIFDVFTRLDGSGDGGFGIGLAVARTLLEHHGGTIEARSAGSGRGSEFVLRLPAVRRTRRPRD